MADGKINRRKFVHDMALGAAGIAAALSSVQQAKAARKPTEADLKSKPKTRSYNPDMEYRRLGKTGLWVSAVCMGGHWKRVDVMKQDFDQNRYDVVSQCIERGINYIDACWNGEVRAYAKALKGRRESVYLAACHGSKGPRKSAWRTAKKLMEGLDELLRETDIGYADLWRMTCLEPGGRHSFDTACEIAEALEKAKKQGKVRFGGFSTHDRRWIKFMIEYFPQVDVVVFPYTAKTKAMPKDSVFEALEKCDVGAFGIKPFASNSLFKGSSAPGDPNAEEDNRRARLAIRYILCNPHIVPIPGLISPQQVDNVARAVMERRQLDLAEADDLDSAMQEAWASLPDNYQWLKNWEYV
jgi:aryl-alcohol dehydrogenase-like predicted oxidoreductase